MDPHEPVPVRNRRHLDSFMQTFDVVVIGLGGIGSAAAVTLARRGVSVLGIDRFSPAHSRGSSHGQTRLFRTAYFEHSDYVPLLRRAAELWRERESETQRQLFARTGVLLAGPAAGNVLTGTITAANDHDVAVETQSATEAMIRWPMLRFPVEWSTIFEPDAGCLFVEACVRSQLQAAAAAGAELRHGTVVREISCRKTSVEVVTDSERVVAGRLVFCPGPWANELLPLPGVPLTVLRKSLFWYRPIDATAYAPTNMPCFGADTPGGFFYATPAFDMRGVKLAEHSGGLPLSGPGEINRAIDPVEQSAVEVWAAAMIPLLGHERSGHTACFYTMSPDRHAVVGHHPNHPQVSIATGFSGHGFKFAPVIGEVLADLSSEGSTSLPVGFLSPSRFSSN